MVSHASKAQMNNDAQIETRMNAALARLAKANAGVAPAEANVAKASLQQEKLSYS